MSDAIKKLHDYLAKSPSVIYPEDVLAYLPAIEAENARLRSELESVGVAAYLYGRNDLLAENAKLRELAKGLYEFAYAEYPRAAKAGFADDLHELGVEVDK